MQDQSAAAESVMLCVIVIAVIVATMRRYSFTRKEHREDVEQVIHSGQDVLDAESQFIRAADVFTSEGGAIANLDCRP